MGIREPTWTIRRQYKAWPKYRMDTMVYNSSANNWATLTLCVWKYYIKQNPLLGLPLCYSYVMQWPFKQRNTTSIIQYLKRNPYLLKKAASVLIKSSFTCILTNLKMCQLSKHQQWKALSRRGEGIVEKHLGVF